MAASQLIAITAANPLMPRFILFRFVKGEKSLKKIQIKVGIRHNGDINDPGNYRPISLISHVAKVFQKQVQSQLTEYLN